MTSVIDQILLSRIKILQRSRDFKDFFSAFQNSFSKIELQQVSYFYIRVNIRFQRHGILSVCFPRRLCCNFSSSRRVS